MRWWLLASTVLLACSGPAKRPPKEPDPDPEIGMPLAAALAGAPKTAGDGGARCIVVQGEFAGQPTSVEGTLTAAKATNGKPPSAPLVLRLARPRCIVGLSHASFVTEVSVASTGTDLRPFLDTPIRVTGEAIGGTNDLGGPAVVILAKDVERLDPGASDR